MSTKPLVVYVMMMVEGGKEREIVEKAKVFPGVTEVKPVYGEYDIVARVELDDLSILEQTVTQIRRIPGVVKTATLISME
ncbi:MAG: Lrp/AsnC ligand binding domain-containing protein [Candidatus Bathyarchaeia archaeon]|nr:Lrp/AsnC ligand binding domain-containing protein [Candidatus Bathyarchaeota archaeon]